jgi:succinylglutamate desuccinylase
MAKSTPRFAIIQQFTSTSKDGQKQELSLKSTTRSAHKYDWQMVEKQHRVYLASTVKVLKKWIVQAVVVLIAPQDWRSHLSNR